MNLTETKKPFYKKPLSIVAIFLAIVVILVIIALIIIFSTIEINDSNNQLIIEVVGESNMVSFTKDGIGGAPTWTPIFKEQMIIKLDKGRYFKSALVEHIHNKLNSITKEYSPNFTWMVYGNDINPIYFSLNSIVKSTRPKFRFLPSDNNVYEILKLTNKLNNYSEINGDFNTGFNSFIIGDSTK